jgi:ABC-type lipoprotein export system ATPase subunit
MMLFKLNNISKHYGSESDGTLRKVLDGLSLEINEGESIAILGPSGSGKTTLLNIMGTLDRPDSGDVFFRSGSSVHKASDSRVSTENRNSQTRSAGESAAHQTDFERMTKKTQSNPETTSLPDRKSELRITDKTPDRPIVKMPAHIQTPEQPGSSNIQKTENPVSNDLFSSKENLVNYSTKELDTFRNQKIGFVFQLHHLLPQCTLLENILIPTLTLNDKKIKAERLIRAKELMERVGIWEQRDQMPGHLSGGECQRAAVVRALINSPGLLLADEPTGALDEDNVSKLALLLLEINKTYGVTLVVVTHSLALAARMDTVYELRNGKLRLKNIKA